MSTLVNAGASFPALCFGKLPACADYLRHNASGRDVLAFDQWLQQGLFHARTELREEWRASYDASPSYHFLFFPENSESFLLGVVKASQDRSERRYPFIVSLRVDRRFPPTLIPLAPVIFASFLEGARQLVEHASEGMSVQEVTDASDQLQTPVERSYDTARHAYGEHLASTSASRMFERLWGAPEDERVLLTFKNLLDVLLPLRGRNAARLAPGLRFPLLTTRPELQYTTSFWLDAAFILTRASSSRPFAFWTATSEVTSHVVAANGNGSGAMPHHASQAHLFLFLREPSSRSVLHLLRPDINSDVICEVDVDGIEQIVRARASLPSSLARALVTEDTKLRALLDMLASPRVHAAANQESRC
ncbi:MAG: type VI secretion system-associated protein TagF [Gemmatimonadaceae bacterium]